MLSGKASYDGAEPGEGAELPGSNQETGGFRKGEMQGDGGEKTRKRSASLRRPQA